MTYTPDTNFVGTDSFTYTVTDGSSRTGIGAISVQVGPGDSTSDDIISELSDIEEAIDNYDVNDPPDLASAASAVSVAIHEYDVDATSFISANDLNHNSLRDIAISGYLQVLDRYSRLQAQADALNALLLASKSRVEDLRQQYNTAFTAAPPDRDLIFKLSDEITNAEAAHGIAQAAMRKMLGPLIGAKRVCDAEFHALLFGKYGGSAAVLNLNPPPAVRLYDLGSYTPKP